MSILKNRRAQIALGVGILAVAGGVFVGTRIAQADGVPQTQPLTYAGTLLDASGNPATGVGVNIDLNLHTTPTGGSPVCTTSGTFNLTTTKGRFQMVLDAACTTAVHATPDLYVDLKVNGGSIFTTRPKLGAVPYALEADTSRVARRGLYENPTTTSESTFGGSYCGDTAITYTGSAVGGYDGAKTKCQNTCNSSTAHMCTTDEMVRYASTGGQHTPAAVWISSGIYATSAAAQGISDCAGFKSQAAADWGVTWDWTSNPSGRPNGYGCNSSLYIACCN